jgi:ferric-dicitrate binding protein FerR (iron transport regulator)
MKYDEAFHVLAETCLDGKLNPDDRTALQKMLAEHPQMRAEFLLLIGQDATLRAIHTRPASKSAQMEAVKILEKAPPRKKALAPRRRGWLEPLAACALLAIAITLYFVFSGKETPLGAHVASAAKDAKLLRNGKESALVAGAPLSANDELRIPVESSAAIDYDDKTHLEISADTFVTLNPLQNTSAPGKCVVLQHGSLTATVSKQPAGQPMRFVTSQAEALVRGTRLTVAADTNSTRLSVDEGLVQFTRLEKRQSLDVAAGQTATVAPNVAFAVAPLTPPHEKVEPAGPSRVQEGLLALYEGKPGEKLSPQFPGSKIVRGCKSTNALSIELWIKPPKLTPNSFRHILTLRGDDDKNMEFIIAEHADAHHAFWEMELSVAAKGHHGTVAAKSSIKTHAPDLGAENLAHFVFTRDANGNEKLYVNGTESAHDKTDGDFSLWDDSHRILVAGEGTGRAWNGSVRQIAIYNRALNEAEVKQNLGASHCEACRE